MRSRGRAYAEFVIAVLLVLALLGMFQVLDVVDDVRLPPPASLSVNGDGPDEASERFVAVPEVIVTAFHRTLIHLALADTLRESDGWRPGNAPRPPHESRGPPPVFLAV